MAARISFNSRASAGFGPDPFSLCACPLVGSSQFITPCSHRHLPDDALIAPGEFPNSSLASMFPIGFPNPRMCLSGIPILIHSHHFTYYLLCIVNSPASIPGRVQGTIRIYSVSLESEFVQLASIQHRTSGINSIFSLCCWCCSIWMLYRPGGRLSRPPPPRAS